MIENNANGESYTRLVIYHCSTACISIMCSYKTHLNHCFKYRLLDSLVVECWHRVREVPGSIPSQGPRHTKDVIKMVPVVPLFSTLSEELR